jgi:endonuclease/exonuclease/phosphatase family metal-dependent hydrolase
MKLYTKFVLRFFGIIILETWLTGCASSCDLPASPEGAVPAKNRDGATLTIATWNLQALFDGSESGMEYDEYRTRTGWTEEKYQARLTALTRAAESMASDGKKEGPPDILAFQELENPGVLKTLAEESLAGKGYGWSFFANSPGSSLGIGVLSRYPLLETKIHSVNSGNDAIPRPVMEIRIEQQNKPLVLFVCHWKSKLGNDRVTESLRRSAARVILRRLREIEEKTPGTPAVILGDLNENYDEFYRQSGAVVSALLPDDPKAAELVFSVKETDFLVLSRTKPPESRYFAAGTAVLYTPWGSELQKGSYVYKNEWETIDHILLNGALFDGKDWEYDSCEVLHREPFTTAAGYPDAYNPRTGHGLSDHLPLLLKLKPPNSPL